MALYRWCSGLRVLPRTHWDDINDVSLKFDTYGLRAQTCVVLSVRLERRPPCHHVVWQLEGTCGDTPVSAHQRDVIHSSFWIARVHVSSHTTRHVRFIWDTWCGHAGLHQELLLLLSCCSCWFGLTFLLGSYMSRHLSFWSFIAFWCTAC